MIDEQGVLEARHRIITAIAEESASLVAGVAVDVGESADAVRPVVELTLRLLLDQPGITKGRAIMRIAGSQAARDGVPAERFLRRFTSTTWMIWEAARAHPSIDQAVLENVGQTLLRGLDLLVGAVADGYGAVDRETVARDAEMRRALLEDILSTAPADPVAARGAGGSPIGTASIRTPSIGSSPSPIGAVTPTCRSRTAPMRSGGDCDDPSRAGAADTFPLPQVLVWRGLVVVLATASWPAADRLPRHLGDLLGPDWVAVAGEPVMGVEGIAATMGRLTLSLRTALRVGRNGWISTPDELALEELVTVDDELLDAAVARELGAVLADGRRGLELIETLEVYIESGQNMRETGRRLHLAPRTVAYRLARIAQLIGHPLDGAALRRMSMAAFAYRMRGEDT